MSPKLIAIIALCSYLASSFIAYKLTYNHWQAKYDQHLLVDAQANEKSATEALAKQQILLQELENAYKVQKHLQEKHDRNVADSRIASDRLRAELDRIKTLPQITHTSTITERANAAPTRLVRAALLGISDSRAGIYAEETDRLRIALISCNAEYNAIRLSQ
jgi:hypothetical protein